VPKQVTNVAADDALTTIYRLSHDEGEEAIAARVAERLGTKPASVAGMLSRLRRDALVRMDAKKRIHLTKAGFERAEQMVRRHRLAECLLVDVMGLDWWRAYEEAHLMEHSISDVTEPLIVKLLGDRRVSPFGYPIPEDGGSAPMSTLRLSDLKSGQEGVVERVFEEDEDLLRFFDEEGIRPSATLAVRDVAAYLGTVTLSVGNGKHELVIGSDAARLIWLNDDNSKGGAKQRGASRAGKNGAG
jgi:DtxR family Mn-dependent transcriptional regulator